ncbi:MAG TPA: IS30 family transposase [Acidobacteriaceae bacterium]
MGKGYKHLSYEERIFIHTQLESGWRPAAIAAGLQRPRSTISRELARNGWRAPHLPRLAGRQSINGGYRAPVAQQRAARLSVMARVERKLCPGSPLWQRVIAGLHQRLSPQQIARTLALMPDSVRLSHETIYTALYAMPRGHLRATILDLLRRAHKKRRTRSTGQTRKKPILNMTLIDDRPSEVLERLVPGHWEGDLIVGKGSRSRVGTLVERTTLFVALVKLEDGRADTAAEAFTNILNPFGEQMRRSMTYDQGSEMAQHLALTERTGLKVYFAHPHSPWERGICENTNGLLRQYLPKATDLSVFSQSQLDDIAWSMNTRPRNSLGWKAPAQLFLPEGSFDFVKHWDAKLNPVALAP